MEVLYISMMMPAAKANNAGAKTLYYYISNLAKMTDIHVTLIAKAKDENDDKVKIDNVDIIRVHNKPLSIFHPIRLVKDVNSKINPFHKMGRTLRYSVYESVIDEGEKLYIKPDVIICEYTQMLYLVDYLKKKYKDSKIIASEHDVSFLGYQRIAENKKGRIERIFYKKVYQKMKSDELKQLSKCDIIIPHNLKDAKLLELNGIPSDKIFPIVAFYDSFDLQRSSDEKSILFYGAMGRNENQEAVLWFVKNVMPLLAGDSVKFIIMGGNPPESITSLADGNKVIVTGFVDDLRPYFSTCMCMVVPLHLGAGIKVKVLEAMAAGIPVLTNNIGIEGIPATDGDDYFKCDTAEEYSKTIRNLMEDSEKCENVGRAAKKLILNKFDLADSYNRYLRLIYSLMKGKL